MNKAVFIPFITLSLLSATTINVPDDHSTIQAGIDASSDGDTVLVAQGTYVENLILQKEIVLASHAVNDDLTDWMGNENIQNTIIVGNEPNDPKKGSCLQVSYGSIEPTILGFTFQDGLGTSMGINDCGVYRTETSGGAILAFQAYPVIMYNRFINNGTSQVGGGNATGADIQNGGAIGQFDTDDVEFDEDRENSGYVNFADFDDVDEYILERALGMDESSLSRDRPVTMVVQNNYFANNSSGNGESFYSHGYGGDIDLSGSVFENIDCESGTVNDFVLHSWEEAATYVQNDISGVCIEENTFYVSSDNGDDNNLGTETEPLFSIRHALSLVKQQTEEVTTIHLEAGVYSKDRNGEVFPIVVPDNVHIIGDEALNTILFAGSDEDNEAATMIIKPVQNVRIANLTLSGGYSEGHGCTGGGGLLITAEDMFNLDTQNGTNIADSYPVIENVIIEDNHSHNGGGMAFFRVNGPVLINVKIRDNVATAFGGGIFSFVSEFDMTDVVIKRNENLEAQGGGMMLANSRGTFDNTTIEDNIGCCHGGGIWTNNSGGPDSYGGWVMTNSSISGNTAGMFGGGINFAWSHPTLINCTINDNTSNWGGGGIDGLESGFTLKESLVSGNFSYGGGGGILAWGVGADPVIEDCIVSENSTGSNGGGIMLNGCDVSTITRTSVVNNEAYNSYGGIYVTDQSATINNVTVYGNASAGGGGIGVENGGHINLTNSIVWGNSGNEIISSGATTNVNYSDVQGGYDGDENIDENPLFTQTATGDYTLTADSPCINAGTADTDGDGVDDITDYNGSAPDMGAFETNIPAVTGFTLYPSTDYVILTWDPTTEDGFQYYLLERSTDEEFTENIVSNYVTDSYYEDNDLEFDTEYFYRVSYNVGDWSEYSEVLSVTLEAVNVDDGNQLPKTYALHQNYPNPFNPVTNLSYDLPEDAMVTIAIYDMMGKVVRTLVNGQQSAGYKTLQWSATNNGGHPISAGLYIYTIQAGDFSQTRKMILLK